MFNSKPHLQIGKGDDPKLRMKESSLMELTTAPPFAFSRGAGRGCGGVSPRHAEIQPRPGQNPSPWRQPAEGRCSPAPRE